MTKNDIKSCFLITITSAVLTLFSMLPIGIFGIIATALLPSVIGYTVTKHHYTFVGLLCAFILLVYSLFFKSFITPLSFWLPLTLCGISLGITYNLKLSEFFTIGVITGVYVIFLLLNVKLSGAFNIESLNNTLFSSADAYKATLTEIYGSQLSQADIDILIKESMSVVVKFMPFLLIILCGSLALLMLYLFKKVLKLTKSDLSIYKPFSDWHAEKSLSIVFLVIFVISFFLPENRYVSDAIANVLFISLFVFYIFGLSLVDFLLKRKLKKSFLRKTILIILVLFSFGLPLFILCLLGIVDGCVNFRDKFTKNNLPEQE